MESQATEIQEAEMDEELCYVTLALVLDRTAHHVVSACIERSSHQAMTALKTWFSGNDAQQKTIDSILDELRLTKLDESITSHECIDKLMELIESL